MKTQMRRDHHENQTFIVFLFIFFFLQDNVYQVLLHHLREGYLINKTQFYTTLNFCIYSVIHFIRLLVA